MTLRLRIDKKRELALVRLKAAREREADAIAVREEAEREIAEFDQVLSLLNKHDLLPDISPTAEPGRTDTEQPVRNERVEVADGPYFGLSTIRAVHEALSRSKAREVRLLDLTEEMIAGGWSTKAAVPQDTVAMSVRRQGTEHGILNTRRGFYALESRVSLEDLLDRPSKDGRSGSQATDSQSTMEVMS